jgi:hypothetical protein
MPLLIGFRFLPISVAGLFIVGSKHFDAGDSNNGL